MTYTLGDKVQVIRCNGNWYDGIIEFVKETEKYIHYRVKLDDYDLLYIANDSEVRDRPIGVDKVATYTSRVLTETVYEYLVPFPANHTEVSKAWMAAEKRYKELKSISIDTRLSDDALWFVPDDENVVIQFKVTKDD